MASMFSLLNQVGIATSSKLILGGKTPSEAFPAFDNRRVTNRLVKAEKDKESPHGLNINGMFVMHKDDRSMLMFPMLIGVYDLYIKEKETLRLEDRYIHCFRPIATDEGGTIILTFNHYLIQLVHQVLYIEVDTTFKRVHGEFNEWEIVTWLKGENRRKFIVISYS